MADETSNLKARVAHLEARVNELSELDSHTAALLCHVNALLERVEMEKLDEVAGVLTPCPSRVLPNRLGTFPICLDS